MKVLTAPRSFNHQKPDTAGLHKPVRTFQQPPYLENFFQSAFDGDGDRNMTLAAI